MILFILELVFYCHWSLVIASRRRATYRNTLPRPLPNIATDARFLPFSLFSKLTRIHRPRYGLLIVVELLCPLFAQDTAIGDGFVVEINFHGFVVILVLPEPLWTF